MAMKIYKQTFKGRRPASEVHEEIGRRGGMIMRLDQSDESTTAYFEADDKASATGAKAEAADVEEVSLKDVTKI